MTSPLPLQAEIDLAMAAVRSKPEAIEPRMALFQLAAVCGDWRRTRTQLETMEKLDSECAMMTRTYGRLIAAEAIRERVFAGDERPVAFGQPSAWLAMMAEALVLDNKGSSSSAQSLRETARQSALARSGSLDGQPFSWIMDADPRLGPVLEVIIEGQYRWLPMEHLAELKAVQPKAMRDMVWQPVTLRMMTETELTAFIPARYPGSQAHPDDRVRRGTETRWIEHETEQFGIGQRTFSTDLDDYAFLDIRRLRFDDG